MASPSPASPFPRSGCPFPIPTPRSERYRPCSERSPRTIITGFFTVDARYGVLREEGTLEHILFHTVQGEGFLVTERGWMTTGPGQTLLIEPRTAHYYATHPRKGHWRFHWVHFFPPPHWTFLHELRPVQRGVRSAHAGDEGSLREIRKALGEAHDLRRQTFPNAHALAMNALERALLWVSLEAGTPARLDNRIRRAIDHIVARPEKPCAIADLARSVGLSTSRFAHLFREQTGQTPQRHIEAVRLDLAAESLQAGGQSVAEIADGLGFSSPFYFSRRFKARFGTSPKHFREKATHQFQTTRGNLRAMRGSLP